MERCKFRQSAIAATLRYVPWLPLCFGGPALFAKHFDNDSVTFGWSFDTPMNSIAGLTEWAQSINHVYAITTIVCTFVFFAVSIPLVYTIYRFRAKSTELVGTKPPKQIDGHHTLELLWTIIPSVLLIFIAVPTWRGIFEQYAPPPENALKVDVIGHQFWWEFYYPDLNIRTASELHLPENTPVSFTLYSDDVIHSWWIPTWSGKLDVLPGRKNVLNYVTPPLKHPEQKGGEYYQGQCAELCGLSHALMRFDAVLHSNEEFTRWAKVYNEPPHVATDIEKRGEQLFEVCASCHTISGTPSEEAEKQLLSMNPPMKKQGPNLSNLGNRKTIGAGIRRNTHENFLEWVTKPDVLKPGGKMLPLGLGEEDLEAIAAYVRYSTAKEF